MARAKKLLIKTRGLENKVRNDPYKSREDTFTLESIKEVQKITYKDKEVFDETVKKEEKTKETKILENKEIESFDTTSNSIMRIDYRFPNEDMGLEMTLPAGIITASGLQPGDYLEILEGELEGRSLEVIEILNSTTLRLDDVPTYSKAEESCKIRFIFN